MTRADAAGVLAEAHVQLPMQSILDAPRAPYRIGALRRREPPTQDGGPLLQARMSPRVGPLRERHPRRAEVLPLTLRSDRRRGREDGIRPDFLTAVSHPLGLMLVD